MSDEQKASETPPVGQRFRKKPVVIEAMQFTGRNHLAIEQWAASVGANPDNVTIHPLHAGIVIHTLEGDHLGQTGDWIICGVQRELYPCKPDIFAATYEPESTPLRDPGAREHAVMALGEATYKHWRRLRDAIEGQTTLGGQMDATLDIPYILDALRDEVFAIRRIDFGEPNSPERAAFRATADAEARKL